MRTCVEQRDESHPLLVKTTKGAPPAIYYQFSSSPQRGHTLGGYLQYILFGKELPHLGQPTRSIFLPTRIQRHMRNAEGTAAARPSKRTLPLKKTPARKMPTSTRAVTAGSPWYAKTIRR